MKRWSVIAVTALVMLLAGSALANPIADPSGIIRPGWWYSSEAVINPDLTLTFGDTTITSFNPFDAGFCMAVEGGQQCDFINKSGLTIQSIDQLFVTTFTSDNPLTCENLLQGTCSAGGNALGFDGLGIPSTEIHPYILIAGYDEEGGITPEFNILYGGFTEADATIARTTFSVPEPASLGLLFTGLLGLGLGLRRKAKLQ